MRSIFESNSDNKKNDVIIEGFLVNKLAQKTIARKMDDMMTICAYNIKNAKSDKEKKAAQERFDKIQMAVYDKDGDKRSLDDMSANINDLYKQDKSLKSDFENIDKTKDEIRDKDDDGWWDADTASQDRASNNMDDKSYQEKNKEYESGQKERTKTNKERMKQDKKDDNKEPEKDEDGNIIKQEEITDADGKKIKVTTHTGPRGGKFYYPDGAPKDDDHKVYIGKDGKVKEACIIPLKDYILESLQ